MKKTTLLIISIAVLIAVLGSIIVILNDSATTGRVVQEPQVKIGYRGHLAYLPAYVAEANKYYEDEGLDVTLVKFDSTNQMVEAVINGQVDAAVGGANAIVPLTIESKAPGSLKIFNQGYYTEEFDALLVQKDSDINSIEDLEGKTISSLPGTAAKIWMEMMIEKEGLERVTVIQTSPSQQLNALNSGSVDAIFVLEPLVTVGIKKDIAKILVKSPIVTYYKDNMLFETSLFSTEFTEENPLTAKKIQRAVDKAIIFINENPEKAKTYYSEFTPVEDDLEADLPVIEYVPSKEMDSEEFQELADYFLETGILSKQVDVSTMFFK
jgi:ABC-type nitrate/sulfonate/bicarbonate transport system substrate-binding protein